MRLNKESNGYKLKKRNSATGSTIKGFLCFCLKLFIVVTCQSINFSLTTKT